MADFSVKLEEINAALEKADGKVLLAGDFNAHSTAWGYEEIDQRDRELTNFLLLNSLFVHNPPDADPSFLTMRGKRVFKGWPDLTIASVALGNDIKRRLLTQ